MSERVVHFRAPAPLVRLATILCVIGGSGFIIGLLTDPDTAWTNLLLVGFLGVGFGLAGILLMAFQYLTAAGWSVGLRRVPEAMGTVLPWAGALVLFVLLAYPDLYPWTARPTHPHSGFKDVWLSRPFFLVRAFAYLAIWLGLAYALIRTSRKQDEDGSASHTFANCRWSALFLILFGITLWLASYDWLMSREPEWASTVFGPYNFAGLFQSGLAVCILLCIWLHHLGPYRDVLTTNHLHDLGKLLFGMSTFWAYLWYCQYMLIWYVNNPEETPYYVRRLEGAWEPVFCANLALNWIMPFFILLSRPAKRSAKCLVQVSVIILFGRWLDLYLMIFPANNSPGAVVIALSMYLGALAAYFLVFSRALAQAALLPWQDPYFVESLPPHATSS